MFVPEVFAEDVRMIKTISYARKQTDKHGWKKVPFERCYWELDEFTGAYFFECSGENRAFEFTNSFKEDGFKFCPYCGKKLAIKIQRR